MKRIETGGLRSAWSGPTPSRAWRRRGAACWATTCRGGTTPPYRRPNNTNDHIPSDHGQADTFPTRTKSTDVATVLPGRNKVGATTVIITRAPVTTARGTRTTARTAADTSRARGTSLTKVTSRTKGTTPIKAISPTRATDP